jgi:hypothetical protein
MSASADKVVDAVGVDGGRRGGRRDEEGVAGKGGRALLLLPAAGGKGADVWRYRMEDETTIYVSMGS